MKNQNLQKIITEQEYSQKIAASATKLSFIEITLGSVIHGFHIPFGGHLLSLNQGIFLCQLTYQFRFDKKKRYEAPLQVSAISGILKSLSPSGQKLGPMLSIGMQGALYSFTILVFGASNIAQSFAMIFLSLWAFLQPIITLWIFYGKDFGHAAIFYYLKTQQSMPKLADIFLYAIGIVFLLKIILAALIPWLLARLGHHNVEQNTEILVRRAGRLMSATENTKSLSNGSAFLAAVKDLLRPAFFIPALMIAGFFYWSESTKSQWIWLSLRPVAMALLFFYLLHAPWAHRFFEFLRGKNVAPGFFRTLDLAAKKLRSRD